MKYHHGDTIVAPATAIHGGAINVIRISGPDVFGILGRIFSGNLEGKPGNTIHYGYIRNGEERIDEVLVSIFRNPNSYTGEDLAEISCHGSAYITSQILRICISEGARAAAEGEFTLRAFLNRKLDLSQAEAVADMVGAESDAARRIAMTQMRGGYSLELSGLREQLIHFASLLELELDFSEEDVEFANRDELSQLLRHVHQRLSELSMSFSQGNAIKNGVPIAIAGRPNAGKSTLLNGLLQEDRAIVSDIPGTTRDTVEETMTINGILFRLVDTAGIRESEDTIEKIGIERALESVKKARAVLYVYDAGTLTPPELEHDLSVLGAEPASVICIANKADLLEDKPSWIPHSHLYISAQSHEDLSDIREHLGNRFSEGTRRAASGNPVLSNVRHYEAIQRTLTAVERAQNGLSGNLSKELISFDIREALSCLGEITGEISSDDLLSNIFSRFCIGK